MEFYILFKEFLAGTKDLISTKRDLLKLIPKDDQLDPAAIKIILLFPDNQPVVHLNYTTKDKKNTLLTLSPDPFNKLALVLVHPSSTLVATDSIVNSMTTSISLTKYAEHSLIAPSFHQRTIEWTARSTPLILKINRGDSVIIKADSKNHTLTSSDSHYNPQAYPYYDLSLLANKTIEIPFHVAGEYYFISRPAKKTHRLYFKVE